MNQRGTTERDDRLKAALRENLRRRKNQARQRGSAERSSERPGEPGTPAEVPRPDRDPDTF